MNNRAISMKSVPLEHIFPTHILILPTYLHLGLPNGHFPYGFQPITYMFPCPHHLCYMPCQSQAPWPNHSNSAWRWAQVMKILTMQLYGTSIFAFFYINKTQCISFWTFSTPFHIPGAFYNSLRRLNISTLSFRDIAFRFIHAFAYHHDCVSMHDPYAFIHTPVTAQASASFHFTTNALFCVLFCSIHKPCRGNNVPMWCFMSKWRVRI
jgi:hypothetical protein